MTHTPAPLGETALIKFRTTQGTQIPLIARKFKFFETVTNFGWSTIIVCLAEALGFQKKGQQMYNAYYGVGMDYKRNMERSRGLKIKNVAKLLEDWLSGCLPPSLQSEDIDDVLRGNERVVVTEIAHYGCEHRVYVVDEAMSKWLPTVNNKCRIQDLTTEFPIFEICPHKNSGIPPMLVMMPCDASAAITEKVIGFTSPESTVREVCENRITIMARIEKSLFYFDIPKDSSADFEFERACLKCPQYAVVSKTMTRFVLNFLSCIQTKPNMLKPYKLHNRPTVSANKPIVQLLNSKATTDMDGGEITLANCHFRKGFFRTLRNARYYGGKQYPPAQWKTVWVNHTLFNRTQKLKCPNGANVVPIVCPMS